MINHTDLVQKNDSKNLLVSQPESKKQKGKNRTKELKTGKTLNSNTGLKMQSLVDTARNTFLEWGKYAVEEFWHYEDKPPETFCDWSTFVSPKTGIDKNTLSEIINDVLIGDLWGRAWQVEQYESNMAFFRGGEKFDYRYVSESGAKLSTRKLDSGLTVAILSLSGGVLSQIFKRNDLLSVALFVKYMVDKGFHFSRSDFAIDDFQKKLDVFQVADWVRHGNYMFFRKRRIIESGTTIKDKNLTTGLTIECGSRDSDFFGRIYDTFVKHKIKATRFEGEFKDEKAKSMQDLLVFSAEEYLHGCNEGIENWWDICNEKLLRNIQNILLSAVSFCDRDKGKRVGTVIIFPEFKEWEEYKEYINKNFEDRRFVTRPKEPSIKRSWQYLHKSVKGTINLFRHGLSLKTVHKLIDLLIAKDDEKDRPLLIDKDRNLLIGELKTHGINAIFNDEELQQIFNEYEIDFGTNTSYYEPIIKEDSLTANKRILRGLLKDKDLDYDNQLRLEEELNNALIHNNYFSTSETLYDDLLENHTIVEFLYKKAPSLFTQLIDKLSNQEREIILEHCEQLV